MVNAQSHYALAGSRRCATGLFASAWRTICRSGDTRGVVRTQVRCDPGQTRRPDASCCSRSDSLFTTNSTRSTAVRACGLSSTVIRPRL